jgi:DNA-binding beta-propeller fold protein YncE
MRWPKAVLAVAVAATGLLLFAGDAKSAPGCDEVPGDCPRLLTELGEFGDGAGQISNPRGVAASPLTGHVFVAETGNDRISEFSFDSQFIKAWGWGVADGTPELQTCTTATGCMAGIPGSGPGQLSIPTGVTVDDAGSVWVVERGSLRVQKFSPSGEFLLVVGGEVNKTKVQQREEQEANAEPVTVTEAQENLCTAASGDICGTGTSGSGSGQFMDLFAGNPIDLGPGGTIYVGDEDRVQKFSEGGVYLGDIPLVGAGPTFSLTVDPTGRLYVISGKKDEDVSNGSFLVKSRVVREIGPAGEEIRRLTGQWQGRKTPLEPIAVSTDAAGNVYVIGNVLYDVAVPPGDPPKPPKQVEEVLAFEPDGDLISFEPDRAGFGAPDDSTAIVSVTTNIVKDTGEPGEVIVGHFKGAGPTYLRSYGVPFEELAAPPSIEEAYVISVSATAATVEAAINPHFTSDTTYQVEYGTGKCSDGGCESLAPVLPASLGGGAVNSSIPTGPVSIGGLMPGTTYHFRFRAQNEAGGPVFGVEGTFRTFADPIRPSCANDVFRTGAAGFLPDCRAYEMVSPVDKQGGEIITPSDVVGYRTEINRGTRDGEKVTYSSYRAFADSSSAPYSSQYLARRDPAQGWISASISPPREGVIQPPGLDIQFKLFSADLSKGWLVSDSEPPLAEGAVPGLRNLYRRDNQNGTYDAQCSTVPIGPASSGLFIEPQAVSADGEHAVFRATGKLTPDAAEGDIAQLYECVGGSLLRLVSELPGGEPSAAGASAGTSEVQMGAAFHRSIVASSVSNDGSRIFWTAASAGSGPLYVRIDGIKSVPIDLGSARFRLANPDGTRVIYSVGSELKEAAVGSDSASSSTIAGQVLGFMGGSEDANLLYFVSREDLDGAGGAVAGQPNLYLYRASADTFALVAVLAEEDAREAFLTDEVRPVLTPVALPPFNRSSRVTQDGLHAAFTATASLTGYDNTDAASGKADAEVFVYDAEAEELVCASCNPTGARPHGENVADSISPFWAAAKIPGWENQAYGSRAISDDGERVFFEAADALAAADTNGVQDVYQWEAVGSGGCTESSSTFSSGNAGCVDLISSGHSPQASQLVDASGDGSDVFFKTTESLWSPDPGLTDIYDARMGGGFAPPPDPRVPCELGVAGDCRTAPPAPDAQAPQSATFVGPGDAIEKPKPKRCRKGTHRVKKGGKVRCVKNRKGKHRARPTRGAGG